VKELIRRTKAITNNQQGFTITLLFLVLLPVIFYILVSTTEMTTVVQSGDMDMQEGMVLAAKAGAEQLDMNLHPQGIFQILPDNANAAYRKVLARNMGLNEATLMPSTKAYSSAPRYCLLVYNGTSTGSTANKKYIFDGSTTTSSSFAPTGFPKSFVFNGLDIVVGSGENSITLDEPGVIVIMSIDQNDLLNNSDRTITRWAVARLKTVN